jgi:Tfp pilus assembly protein PilF
MPKNPQQAAKLFQKGTQAMVGEQFGIARGLLLKALSFDKDNPDIMGRLAQVYIATWETNEAIDLLRRSLKRRPNHPDTMLLLSQAHMQLGQLDAMHEILDKALKWDPAHGACTHAKVMGYINSGTPELAAAVLDAYQTQGQVHPLVLMARGKLARTEKRYADAIAWNEQVLEHEKAFERHKRSARFELGHCHDALGEYDRAFEYFRIGNGGHMPGHVMHPESVINMWSRELLDSIPRATTGSQRPVFIVGMPRSGTTLTEQVLAAHPGVACVGEAPMLGHLVKRKSPSSLSGQDIEQYAAEYLSMLNERVGTGADRVVDKHMGAEQTLGLISRMFPEAKVIHCMRDPIDSCLSSYFQNFGTNVMYARDLRTLGQQYVAHRRVMDHWYEVLDLEIMPSVYEELVADFEPRARALVDHLGLDFHEDCLRFHESKSLVSTASSVQVRSPIYQSSTQRWRNYEQHIGPLIEALGEYADTRVGAGSTEQEST